MLRRNRCAKLRCKRTLVDEFELIRRFFDRGGAAAGVVTGIGDDGAILDPSPGTEQIQVIDTLVEGVHFPHDTDAADIGYRVVAVNLSDIAAMGGRPRWMTLALTLPPKEERWVDDFASGLFAAAREFDVALVGGDMTGGENVVATIHMTGEVARGAALLRSGAQEGDTIYVSGTCGDAAAGLELLQRGTPDDLLAERFLRPRARIELGSCLAGRASAAIDVSDGLVGDLGKLLQASNVGGEIDIDKVPVSAALTQRFDKADAIRFALTGGDDYELCFTACEGGLAGIDDITAIGRVIAGDGLTCLRDGAVVEYEASGYRHFA